MTNKNLRAAGLPQAMQDEILDSVFLPPHEINIYVIGPHTTKAKCVGWWSTFIQYLTQKLAIFRRAQPCTSPTKPDFSYLTVPPYRFDGMLRPTGFPRPSITMTSQELRRETSTRFTVDRIDHHFVFHTFALNVPISLTYPNNDQELNDSAFHGPTRYSAAFYDYQREGHFLFNNWYASLIANTTARPQYSDHRSRRL